jgi:hypothetical protein
VVGCGTEGADQAGKRPQVAPIGSEGIDQRRGDDDGVCTGTCDGSDVGWSADAKTHGDRHG